MFHINETSGCITLQSLPIHLKREIFNIKVRVSMCFMFIRVVYITYFLMNSTTGNDSSMKGPISLVF